MTFYRRHLPHLFQIGQPVFVTWRLHGSLPPGRSFPSSTITSGQAFVAMDRLLDEARTGPLFLRQEPLAEMIVQAIHQNASVLEQYSLHAFVVMANHVHFLISPRTPLPAVMKSLKGITAKRANLMLARAGRFWQEESYDHQVRNNLEFARIRRYIEENPVRIGLVREAAEFPWSSAREAAGGPLADQGVRPTAYPGAYLARTRNR